MADLSELRLVEGMTPALYQKLAPYLTALPTTDSRLNINSMAWPLFAILADGITPTQAKAIAACRQENSPFISSQDFSNLCWNKLNIPLDSQVQLLTSSNYFLLQGYAKMGQQQLGVASLLLRQITAINGNNTVVVSTLWSKRI